MLSGPKNTSSITRTRINNNMAVYTKKTINRRRGSNMVNKIGAELGLTEKQIDDLFIAT